LYVHEVQCKVQMERWDSKGLDINDICAKLGETCVQLFSILLAGVTPYRIIMEKESSHY